MTSDAARRQMVARMARLGHAVEGAVFVVACEGDRTIQDPPADRAFDEVMAVGCCRRCAELYSATFHDAGGEALCVVGLTGGPPGLPPEAYLDLPCPGPLLN